MEVMNERQPSTEEQPLEPRRSGTVSMPGTRVSGGLEQALGPRSEWQRFEYSTEVQAINRGYPRRIHRRNEVIRSKVPLIGEWIADRLHSKMLDGVIARRVSRNSARF